MSDFSHNVWPWLVGGVTAISMAACLLLLWLTGKVRVSAGEDPTTGHVWDEDLQEMNNPLPRWWVGLFIITVVFAVGYLVLFPGMGSFAGKLGWSSAGQHQAEVLKSAEEVSKVYAQFKGMTPEQMGTNPAAKAIGERLFMNNCAQCHGSDARGSKGFPNLTDNDWLYGGEHAQIVESITNGRAGNMPPMAAAVGSAEDVRNLAHYVLSLSGSPHDSLRAAAGKPKFATCAACHGPAGKGNTALGAPNLTDDVWLHGWGEAAIVSIVTQGKVNAMPAQAAKLTEPQIQVLAAYVASMSRTSQQASK
jgi:cytochrome c oxidase cbb3-type subunit 3